MDTNNKPIENSEKFNQEYSNINLEHLTSKYMDETAFVPDNNNNNDNKKIFPKPNSNSNPNPTKYKIISESTKITLDPGTYDSETKCFISTTLLNQDKLYDGLTKIELIFYDEYEKINQVKIESIKIRSRAINNPNDKIKTYRQIQWDLEFDSTTNGYKILGLDNFTHISLIGLEDVFLDVEYRWEQGFENINQYKIEFVHTKCFYNHIIKTNLKNSLYENEEYYASDIIDFLEELKINLDNEEKKFGNIYGTNYNILRIMTGLGGLGYAN
jgi:hypothetical protein